MKSHVDDLEILSRSTALLQFFQVANIMNMLNIDRSFHCAVLRRAVKEKANYVAN